jgi:hypothetical protein
VNFVIQSTVSGEFIAADNFLFATPFVAFAKRFTFRDAAQRVSENPRLRLLELETVPGFYQSESAERFAA